MVCSSGNLLANPLTFVRALVPHSQTKPTSMDGYCCGLAIATSSGVRGQGSPTSEFLAITKNFP